MLPTWTTLPNGSQHGAWIFLLAFFQATVFLTTASHVPAMSAKEKRQLRDQVKDMFLHGYHSYMDNAFPADELVGAQKEVELDPCVGRIATCRLWSVPLLYWCAPAHC